MPFSSATVLEADDAATGMKRSYGKFAAWVLLNFGNEKKPFHAAASRLHSCISDGMAWKDIAAGKQPSVVVEWKKHGTVFIST